jgi:hypothetical protein
MRSIARLVVATCLFSGVPRLASAGPGGAVGTFRELVPRRVVVAAASGGREFAVTLDGPSAPVPLLALDISGGKGPLSLLFERQKFRADRLAVFVRLRNGAGSVLSGLRLDVTGASVEEADGGAGTRDLGISPPSPLWFGELSAGRESASVLLEVDLLDGGAAKGRIVLRGTVSGAVVSEDPAEADEASRAYRSQLRTRQDCPGDLLEGLRGDGFGQADGPILCRFDPSGRIWVIDASGDPVKLFDSRSGFLRSFGPDAGRAATDLAFGADGRIYLFEAGERRGTGVLLRTLRLF